MAVGAVGRKTERAHWDAAWGKPPRLRLPVPLLAETRDWMNLLRRYVRPGSRFLEIGCAPGKRLAWVGEKLGARVAGLDYSPTGVHWSREVARAVGVEADIREEDAFRTTFGESTFDVVYSAGVIEHFDDPREIVRVHVRLAKPGGVALIAIPRFHGWLERLQRRLDPANLAIHNLRIMTPEALRALAPADLAEVERCEPFGRISLSAVNLQGPLGALGWAIHGAVWGAAQLQPATLAPLAPQLLLVLRRKA